jgi:hypothetical protein
MPRKIRSGYNARRGEADKMKSVSKTSLRAIIFALVAGAAQAALPAAHKAEVDHLLKFVRQTTCKIERNGKMHDGSAAASHIAKKFDYFSDEIHSTEQFIDLSATRSTVSGRYYMVQCGDGEHIRTRDWLLQELDNFRANGKL